MMVILINDTGEPEGSPVFVGSLGAFAVGFEPGKGRFEFDGVAAIEDGDPSVAGLTSEETIVIGSVGGVEKSGGDFPVGDEGRDIGLGDAVVRFGDGVEGAQGMTEGDDIVGETAMDVERKSFGTAEVSERGPLDGFGAGSVVGSPPREEAMEAS